MEKYLYELVFDGYVITKYKKNIKKNRLAIIGAIMFPNNKMLKLICS
jgi:hypothetical protein